ncbi:hypothetical protein [Pseudonocardia humida]|uniref:Uncharacterized protein n=1 Tax=Pseudonocardia humida TaxID=2800819 RepID=A0ABT0ZZR6_9PSEU|nr:hypothetical protein [Pseudonocardia humida]MCO1656216.1 hypothetical protein [Pseudonocardia humida]
MSHRTAVPALPEETTMDPAPQTAPDPEPARRRRRRAAALGLIALPVVGSAFVLPAIANAQAGVAPAAFVSPGTDRPAGTDPDQAAVLAYLDAGYTYQDSLDLAAIWGLDLDPFGVKVEAGSFLERGVALKASPLADPTLDDGASDEQLVDLFFALGYTGEDAAVLAEQWELPLGEAKVAAGRELKVVGVLPFVDVPPVDEYVPAAGDDAALAAFFDTGHDYDDAVALAAHWGLGEPFEAKLKAGGLLRSGEALPSVPGVGD